MANDYWRQQQMGMMNVYGQSAITNTATSLNYYIAGVGAYPPQPETPKAPETAVAWLDRRVDEMRVKL